MGYVFFDTETTGLSPAFDQILHFAAVHTDHELREIDSFEIRSRLQPHVVPHPKAMLVNGLSIGRLTDPDLPTHAEMVIGIRQCLLSWSPAIFAGYNSIGFDEEMLRHALFQTLLPPYLTSGRQCGRADAYGLVQVACAFDAGCIDVPMRPDGRRDFRLASILAANGLDAAGAHDAMSDARGTVALCRLVRDRSPAAWERFVRLSSRAAVAELVDEEQGFVLTEFFGAEPVHRAVVCVGRNPDSPIGRFCLELDRDPDAWRRMSDAEVAEEVARRGTPLRRLRINGAPTVTPLDKADRIMPGLDIEHLVARARLYLAAGDVGARLIALYTSGWKTREASPWPEACLYSGGFVNDEDERTCADFHDGGWAERLSLVGSLQDPRLRQLAVRLLYSERRSILAESDRAAADAALADRLLDRRERGPLTLVGAIEEVDRLTAEADSASSMRLAEYRSYLNDRLTRAIAFRDGLKTTV